MLQLLRVCLVLSLMMLGSSRADGAPRGNVCRLPGGPTNSAYLLDMKERFYRNLPAKFSVPKDVVLRFFLTGKGCIRDLSIIKSSGSPMIDIACADSAYCASPLPDPPTLRTGLKAPPDAFLYEPNEYGEGVYTFTFSKSSPSPDKNEQMAGTDGATKISTYELPLIPKEVLFRYPGIFTADELAAPVNKIEVNADPYLLECMRSPWSLRYTISNPPSKSELLDFSHRVRDEYIGKKRVTAQ